MKVWVLQHERSVDERGDVKLIGVYASAQDAIDARNRAERLPGFRDHAQGFSIDPYDVGRDHWQGGFVTPDAGPARGARERLVARRARAS